MSGQRRVILEAVVFEEYHEFKNDFKWSVKMKKVKGYLYFSGPRVYKSAEEAYEALTRFLETGSKR